MCIIFALRNISALPILKIWKAFAQKVCHISLSVCILVVVVLAPWYISSIAIRCAIESYGYFKKGFVNKTAIKPSIMSK